MPRKRTKPPVTGPLGELGKLVTRARGERSLESLAESVGASAGTISRIESGTRAPGAELTIKLSSELHIDPLELLELLPTLPEPVLTQLQGRDIRLAVAGESALPPRTWDALRRRHLAATADRYLARVGGAVRTPVDIQSLLHYAGVRVVADSVPDGPVAFLAEDTVATAEPRGTPRYRFLLAHALAHKILGHSDCQIDGAADEELDATTLAAFLLVPGPELLKAARVQGSRFKPWESEAAGVIVLIASQFGVPIWMVTRRLSEDGVMADLAKVDER